MKKAAFAILLSTAAIVAGPVACSKGGDKAAATSGFVASTSVIDKIADKKIIHKNAAARHKSRLAAALKAMA